MLKKAMHYIMNHKDVNALVTFCTASRTSLLRNIMQLFSCEIVLLIDSRGSTDKKKCISSLGALKTMLFF